MSFGNPYLDDDFLTGGVMSRRCIAWVLDFLVLAVLVWVLWWILVMFGFLTFGLGFGAMSILPFVPFCYHFLSLLSAASATPGQRMMGLTVRRNYDLGPPDGLQALVSVLLFYLTIGAGVAMTFSRSTTVGWMFAGAIMLVFDSTNAKDNVAKYEKYAFN